MSAPEPHHNQPGGEYVELSHVAIRGREREFRDLVDATRRLSQLVITAELDAAETARAATSVESVVDALRRYVPAVPIERMGGSTPGEWIPHEVAPYDVFTGMYNPVALPLRMRAEGNVAVGEGTFNVLYAGPPGCLHGAVIAGCFDMVLAGANRLAGTHGPTANLTTTYRSPTRLDVPVEFRCWQDRQVGRKIFAKGELHQGDAVTATCEGLFIHLASEQIRQLGAD